MANGTLAASQIEMLSQSGTGIITITPPATNTNRAITLPDAAGAIVVSGTTPSLNGITFPATQVASAGANTLDDYEEGTWTISPAPSGGGTITAGQKTGSYTRVGRLVNISGFCNVSSVSTPSGALVFLNGLPFPVASLTEQGARVGGSLTFFNGSVQANVPFYMVQGESRITIQQDASLLVGGFNRDWSIGLSYVAA